jgi:hypothetical protein
MTRFCLLVCGLALAITALGIVRAEESSAPAEGIDPAVREQVRQAIGGLDDEEFTARDEAAGRLQQLVENPALGPFLASQFGRVLLAPNTSFEVRARLEHLLKQLPQVPAASDSKPSLDELGAVLDRLNSDSSVARDSAQRRLNWMLRQTDLIGPVLLELKHRLADSQSDAHTRRTLEPLLDQAREAWLLADPASVPLPPVRPDQIAHWIDTFLQPEDGEAGDRIRHATAERELFDLLARDDSRPQLLQALSHRIAATDDTAVHSRLQPFIDYARPAMVAEVWKNYQHVTVQHLIVGVPQVPENALRATHFDRIDDHTAHCVSGNSLSEGDYPVGVAIPDPEPNRDCMFHLINAPTPRRHLAYEYQLKRDDGKRLQEISRRTLDDILEQQAVLTESQVLMLGSLDPSTVSRFVGPYFQAVSDHRLLTTNNDLAGQLTINGGICYMLTQIGTHEAVSALEQLARSGQLGKPGPDNSYQIAWIAALAIAQRDPWPGADDWLAGLIDDSTPLVTNVDPSPQLGATAAALLLDRQAVSTRPFGLEPAGQTVVERFRFSPYRFLSAKDHEDVRRWWQKQKQTHGKKPAPAVGRQLDGPDPGPPVR